MNLSNQAVGALMMALQKSLFEQSDIVPMLQEMDFVTDLGDPTVNRCLRKPPQPPAMLLRGAPPN